jgi:hypothetical protein
VGRLLPEAMELLRARQEQALETERRLREEFGGHSGGGTKVSCTRSTSTKPGSCGFSKTFDPAHRTHARASRPLLSSRACLGRAPCDGVDG